MTALGRRELALSTVGTVVRQQHFDFGKLEKEVPGMTFGAAVRCIVAIQESGILNLVLSCKRLREEGRVVERVVTGLKGRITVTYNAAARFVKKPLAEGLPTLAQAKEVLLLIEGDRDFLGRTRLHAYLEAVKNRNDAQQLIEHGADVNSSDMTGETVLMRAAADGLTDIVRAVLDARANLESRCNGKRWTALLYAAKTDRVDVVDLLLERKADVKAIGTELHKSYERSGSTGQIGSLGLVTAYEYRQVSALDLTSQAAIRERLIKAGALPTSAKKPTEGGSR